MQVLLACFSCEGGLQLIICVVLAPFLLHEERDKSVRDKENDVAVRMHDCAVAFKGDAVSRSQPCLLDGHDVRFLAQEVVFQLRNFLVGPC